MAEGDDELRISTEKVCFVVVKAREYGVKDVATVPDPGSNAADDNMISVLEDRSDDPVEKEIAGWIAAMSDDEQIDLVALAWLGRGDGTREDWAAIREEATNAHNSRTAAYLLGMPLLPEYLEEGLAAFDRSCRDIEAI